MARYTIKNLRKEVQMINTYVIADTEYFITVVRLHGKYYLYQVHKDTQESRVIHRLFAGTARECETFLYGLRCFRLRFPIQDDLPF